MSPLDISAGALPLDTAADVSPGRVSCCNAAHTLKPLSPDFSVAVVVLSWAGFGSSGRHFHVKSTPSSLTFPRERHRRYTICHWKDHLRCPLSVLSRWVHPLRPAAPRPPPAPLAYRCRSELFQHRGAVHSRVSGFKVDRTVRAAVASTRAVTPRDTLSVVNQKHTTSLIHCSLLNRLDLLWEARLMKAERFRAVALNISILLISLLH